MPEHQQIQQSKKTNTIFQKQATPVIQIPLSNPYSIIQRARINPKSLTHADIMQLQRTIGNQAVGRLLSSIGNSSTAQQATVQRQEIPEEDEPLQGKMAETIQRQEIPEEKESLQGKMMGTIQRQEIPEEEETLQGKFENKPEIACPSCFAVPIVQRQEIPEEEEPLQTKTENNTGMPDNLKAGVENLSGIDMSDVRVHYNSDKPAEVGALAYTQGTNIHVASGQERHLPHEAWHVVQQKQGRVKPTMQAKGMAINNDRSLENEADLMGERAKNKVGLNILSRVQDHKKQFSISQDKCETVGLDFKQNYGAITTIDSGRQIVQRTKVTKKNKKHEVRLKKFSDEGLKIKPIIHQGDKASKGSPRHKVGYKSHGDFYYRAINGRRLKIAGPIKYTDTPRKATPKVPYKRKGDEAGHLIAHSLGGPDVFFANFVAMKKTVNGAGGDWGILEAYIRKRLKAKGVVAWMSVTPQYSGTVDRPDKIMVTVHFNRKPYKQRWLIPTP